MVCPFCGTKNREKASFCISCGRKLTRGGKSFQPGYETRMKPSAETVQYQKSPVTVQVQKAPVTIAPTGVSAGVISLRQGRYKIIRQLGEGGMGRVFLARDTALEYPVVAKEMLPQFVNRQQRIYMEKRFKEEAKLLFRLKHLSLPRVTDFFSENGSLYLIMEYVEGKNLEDIVRKRKDHRITMDEFFDWIRPTLGILKYLHNQEPPIIHRDIKPSNIMLNKSGQIYLVDFGVARTVGTQTFTHVGTPGFASLEHYTGKISVSSDLYSLGATFHFLLSGDDPRNRKDFDFPDIADYRDDVPENLQLVFDRLLAMNQDDRYQDADDVLKDLEDVSWGISIKEHKKHKPIPPDRPVDKKKVKYQAEPASLSPLAKPLAEPGFSHWGCINTLEEHSNNVVAIDFSPDSKKLASASWDETIVIWNTEKQVVERLLRDHKDWVCSVCFSPDGKFIASASYDGTIKIWYVGTGDCIRTLTGHSSYVKFVSYSPDGQYLASSSYDRTVKIWDAGTGKCLNTFKGHSLEVWSIAYSPDGQYLASGSVDRTIKIWDLSRGSCIKTLEGHKDWVYSVAFSPDGKYLASSSRDKVIHIWNLENDISIRNLKGHYEDICSVAFSPNGKFIASGSYDKTIKIWDVDTGFCLRTLNGHEQGITFVRFFPDGKFLGSCSIDQAVKIWGNK